MSEIRHDSDAMLYRNQSDTECRTRGRTDSRKSSQGAGRRGCTASRGAGVEEEVTGSCLELVMGQVWGEEKKNQQNPK